MARQIDIVSLYPKVMNIYGDSGNVLTVERRLALYGYEPRIHAVNQTDPWPDHAVIILGGGGQDNGQRKFIEDLFRRADMSRASTPSTRTTRGPTTPTSSWAAAARTTASARSSRTCSGAPTCCARSRRTACRCS